MNVLNSYIEIVMKLLYAITGLVFVLCISSCGNSDGETDLSSTDLKRIRNEETGRVVMYYEGEPFTGTVTDSLPQSGVDRLETSYKDGYIHGKQTGWYPDGTIEREFNFHEGYPHGKQVMYQPNGQKFIESNFEYGKKDGEFKHWYDNGRLSSVITYQSDVEISRIEYAPDGSVRDSTNGR